MYTPIFWKNSENQACTLTTNCTHLVYISSKLSTYSNGLYVCCLNCTKGEKINRISVIFKIFFNSLTFPTFLPFITQHQQSIMF